MSDTPAHPTLPACPEWIELAPYLTMRELQRETPTRAQQDERWINLADLRAAWQRHQLTERCAVCCNGVSDGAVVCKFCVDELAAGAASRPQEEDPLVNIVRWLRGAGYLDAANALAILHVEDCALRGVRPSVYEKPTEAAPEPDRG